MSRVLSLSNGNVLVILNPASGDEVFVSNGVREAVNRGEFEELVDRAQMEFASAVDGCFELENPDEAKSRLESLRMTLERFNDES